MIAALRIAACAIVVALLSGCGQSSSPSPAAPAAPPSLELFLGTPDAVSSGTSSIRPFGVAIDSSGILYVVDSNNARSILRILPTREMTTFVSGVGSVDHGAITTDGNGNVFFSDFECVPGSFHCTQTTAMIHRVTPSGISTTVVPTGSTDGTSTIFYRVFALAADSAGNIYVGDVDRTIRRVSPDGNVTFVAGGGNADLVDGVGAAARFTQISAMTVDNAGNVFVADNSAIRKVSTGGAVTTIAGTGAFGYADGIGANAQFGFLSGIAVDESGNIYVTDSNYVIRRIDARGLVSTIAGTRGQRGFVTGPLPGIIDSPTSVVVHGNDLFFGVPGAIAVIRNRPGPS